MFTPLSNSKGEKVREGVQAALRRNGVKATVTGMGSLFQTHFPHQEGVVLNSPQSINQSTDIEKREGEFRIRMLAKGVHMMHGGEPFPSLIPMLTFRRSSKRPERSQRRWGKNRNKLQVTGFK